MKTVFTVILLVSFAFARRPGKERISRTKCQEYNELLKKNNICNDGDYSFVGAIGVDQADSFLEIIGYEQAQNLIQWTCSGALISEQYFLSTAHCAYNLLNRSPAKYIRLGAKNFTDTTNSKIFNISEIIRHPFRKARSLYNDVALFKLKTPVKFDQHIQPACLYSGADLTEYDLAGYSYKTKGHARDSPVFLHEHTEVATKEKCNEAYPPNRRLANGVKFESQYCSKDGPLACQLSSASVSLQQDEELTCMQNVAGLGNNGLTNAGAIGCASDTIGLNVKISAFVSWIESVVWP